MKEKACRKMNAPSKIEKRTAFEKAPDPVPTDNRFFGAEKSIGRRRFIRTGAAALSAVSVPGVSLASRLLENDVNRVRPLHVFTKCLQFMNYDEMAALITKLGFAGADLAVRPGGQVLPGNVETDLPKALKSLRNAGVDSRMITTSIKSPDDEFTRLILKTMAELGIGFYRMGYLDYDNSKSITENIDAYRFTFEKFEKLNREYGVHGGYQNHSGRRVGGPVWDLFLILKDRDPEFVGVQYDVRHATIEGGASWPLGMKLLAPWIRTVDIKDFVWSKNESGKWAIKNVPLGEGMVNFEAYFELYKSLKFEGPVSIHYEYNLGGAEHGSRNPEMPLNEISTWLERDLIFMKNQFREFGL
ncbi:Sugar phosphate isomerase/epimerase [Mariniphaga anaerophila]|uniref:Sugar phosphate isomerase/epimerase n=1 Tax=Mariniphaga anaerophila TaxID=1484053 RepID=A0A1M5FS03_9BACT|nr:TIM barrel protein [Mariniphaga anaerophila]SHF94194.1 Sugar phosphate isomerase/epimerase [Mariniphaga anaerophila]